MPYFKLAAIVTLIFSITSHAVEPLELTDYAAHAKKSIEEAKAKGWLNNVDKPHFSDEDLANAKLLADSAVKISQKATLAQAGQLTAEQEKQKINLLEGADGALFISLSMPRQALIEAFKVAKEHNLTILLRGMKEGSTHISTTMKILRVISAAAKVEPNVGINPLRFEEFNIVAVPTIVLTTSDRNLIVPGTLDMDYVKAQLDGDKDRLEQVGQTFDITEPDMIKQMQAAASKIDWKEKQRLARARFWKNYKTHELPFATDSEYWLIDPTTRVVKDIKNGKDEILAHAGTVINPLMQIPAALTILVINPYSETQIEWAKQHMNKANGMYQIHITHVDKKNGWNDFADIRKKLKVPVYVLPEQVINKFKVKATPTIIETRSDGLLQVQQFKWDDKE